MPGMRSNSQRIDLILKLQQCLIEDLLKLTG